MTHLLRAFALGLVALSAGWLCADEANLAPHEGVLVLRNGQILRGAITRVGDNFEVAVDQNSSIRIPTDKAEFACRDLHEALRIKLQSIRPDNVDARLDLAEWCMRHGLLGSASEQLRISRGLWPGSPRLAALERRFQLAAATTQQAVESSSTRTAPTINREELDDVVRNISPEIVQEFSRTVQPILLNRCAATGCHGPNPNSAYRLTRTNPHQALARVITQRNLHATLQRIDIEQPDNSPLLKIPKGPHGDAESAVLGPYDQAQFEQLAQWVRQVAVDRRTSTSTANLADAIVAQPADQSPAPLHADVDEELVGQDDDQPFVPRDPFDAEIFNRRFHSSSKDDSDQGSLR